MDRLTGSGLAVVMTQHHTAAGAPALPGAATTGRRVVHPLQPAPARPATPPATPSGPAPVAVTGGLR
ncbi:hypothetical protein C1701_01445 [Actinoalloteichus sp. AHMU CJ021]|nr:hypothetical protein C1701_01445 [Actinoalloteichus sp. AHMU CJ021]